MKLRSKILGALGSAALLTAGLTAAAAPASAACYPEACSAQSVWGTSLFYGGATVGNVTWKEYGEHLIITDFKSDGMAIVGRWAVDNWYGGQGSARNTLGVGYPLDVNLDFPEGYRIQFQACLYKGTTQVTCTSWVAANTGPRPY